MGKPGRARRRDRPALVPLFAGGRRAEGSPGGVSETGGWIAGRLARRKAGETPDGLCDRPSLGCATIRPTAPRRSCPGDPTIFSRRKRSRPSAPPRCSYASRDAWDSRFARSGAPFDSQEITITAPASFDAAAQRLTLDAAKEAGYPDDVRLLEEPQAAFYCWLERYPAAERLWERVDKHTAEPRRVLIVDIGGGTSDFSLFELKPGASGAIPDIKRVAVSEHILLGGDNIDLTLAVIMEPRLLGERGQMSGPQWDHLVASCRDLKERALSGSGLAEDHYVLALPGRGSSLITAAQTATLAQDEVEQVVLDGFFPLCDARARPFRTQTGLRDWGLPYPADSAITRHLADFLRDRPRVDAVLFNGGSLHAAVLRQRLLDQIAAWQDGARPIELENADPDLAVARGAARFGELLHADAGRIAAGAARAVFLQAQTAAARHGAVPASLICVLPLNAVAEQAFEINLPGLELRTDQLVSFRACSSTRHDRCESGDILPWDPDAFHMLPPLETIIRTADGADAGPCRTVPVRLAAKMNALGLLQISCVGTDPQAPQSWPLEFNLRPHEHGRAARRGAPAPEAVAPNATAEAQQAARDHIATTFTRPSPKSGFTANAVLKTMERTIGLPRHEWNAALLRTLWPALNEQTTGRKLSVEHEEAWLTLAGFFLRPGFGFAHDGLRMDDLWRLRDAGLYFPGKRSKVQEFILWRRVAGGLTAERQESLLAGELAVIRAGKASPELVRLAGSLERLHREIKSELIETFIAQALERAETKQHSAPYLAALGLLLNRTPLYAGPETVSAAEFVVRAYSAFQKFDWAKPELMECCILFLEGGARR